MGKEQDIGETKQEARWTVDKAIERAARRRKDNETSEQELGPIPGPGTKPFHARKL